MPDDEPMLTPDEEAELVKRINANPNLHPLPPVGKDAALIERLRRTELLYTGAPNIQTGDGSIDLKPETVLVNPDGPEAADRLSVMEEALRAIQRDYIHDGAIYARCAAAIKGED